jgi:glyoxylate/hydroxypyruvate reductase A
MSLTVPFIHQLTNAQEAMWLDALRVAAPTLHICRLADLTQSERDAVCVAIVANPNPAELSDLPNLGWVQSLWAGVERLLQELPQKNIDIVRLIDPQLGDTMAEAVLAWTLYLHRDMPRYAAQQQRAIWAQHVLPLASDRTVGVLGLGHLGAKAAQRLAANGFNVLGWNRSVKQVPQVETLSGLDGLNNIAARSDIIVVLVPSTPQTRGVLGKEFLAQIKPGAAFINFARADIIDNEALFAALNDGRASHAVLDVHHIEPLPQTDPAWDQHNLTILPHIAAPTHLQSAARIVSANLTEFMVNGTIPPAVSRDTGY